MILDFNKAIKLILTFVLIISSVYFFYHGYKKLNFKEIISSVEVNVNINVEKEKQSNKRAADLANNQNSVIFKKIDTPDKKILTETEEVIITVKKNDTFSKLINPFVKNNKIKQNIINVIESELDLKKLNIGQKIFLYLQDLNKKNNLIEIIIPLNYDTDLIISKNENGKFISNKIKIPIQTGKFATKYKINYSLFEDGRANDIPLAILSEIIRLYSFDIDFQRDIQKDDQLELMYNIFYNEQRRTVSYGEIEYINLIQNKRNIEYFLFKTSEGLDYFNRQGKNVRKTLMKTPLDGAKISSNYGMRKHPILGYNKMHRGVDFAAPKGTPVYAAGNGTIEFSGRNGGYGKYIRIRHNSSYKTAYAHLNSFNKGISKGVRVKQGQIIGYVGSTGRSTGPHLHYEVMFQGQLINPMKMKLPSGKSLKGNELKKFIESSNIIYSNFLFNLFE